VVVDSLLLLVMMMVLVLVLVLVSFHLLNSCFVAERLGQFAFFPSDVVISVTVIYNKSLFFEFCNMALSHS